jgi:ASC-1-like (ASCH) protein
MDHVAIMRKSWGLLPKILDGSKVIESRWYKNKSAPWGKVNVGDSIYFKNSGEPVTVKAQVTDVKLFENLTHDKVEKILEEYAELDGIEKKDIPYYSTLFKDKNYCLLIYLENIQEIEPFNINKKGFGAMAAWISVSKIDIVRI